MTTAFSATLIHGPVYLGPNWKMAAYKIQMASSYSSGGDTADLSGEFDYVFGAALQVSGVVDDHGYKLDVVGGTYDSTYCGYPAAAVKICAHNSAGSAAAFAESSGDLSSISDAILIVHGI